MGFEFDADDLEDKEPASIPREVVERFGAVSGEIARRFANRLQLELSQELPAHARIELVRTVSDATALALQAARDARR